MSYQYIGGTDTTAAGFRKTNENFQQTKKELENMAAKEHTHKPNEVGAINPNLLDNGDFQIWQRGTDITTTGTQYTADMWKEFNSNVRVTRETNTAPVNSNYSLKAVNITKNARHIYIWQMFENWKWLNGKTLTFSGWVRSIGGLADIGIRIGRYNVAIITLTGEWQYVTLTAENPVFDESQTVGRTQGLMFCTYSATSEQGQGFELAGLKVEYGDVATPFIPKSYAEELAACQRYTLVANKDIYGKQAYTTGSGVGFFIPTPVTMRTKPSFSGDFVIYEGNTLIEGFTIHDTALLENGVYLYFAKSSHELANGTATIMLKNGAILNANL